MKKGISKIICSLAILSAISLNFVSCGNSNKSNVENKPQSTRPSRKAQVSMGDLNNAQNDKTQSLYSDGEIVSLADGSKLKYSVDGNHEIVEQGDGLIIIFKNVKDEDLGKLDANQRELVRRQMESDPNGFSLIY